MRLPSLTYYPTAAQAGVLCVVSVVLTCAGCGGAVAKAPDAFAQDRHQAWDALERGDADDALTLAHEAQQRARARLDDAAVAESSYLVALSLVELDGAGRQPPMAPSTTNATGAADVARHKHLQQAMAALDEARWAAAQAKAVQPNTAPGTSVLAGGRIVFDTLYLSAVVARLCGRPDQAAPYLATLLSMPEAEPADRALAATQQGLLASDRHDVTSAGEALKRAEAAAIPPAARSDVAAAIARLRGQIQILSGQPADAAVSFGREVDALEQWRLYRAVPWALAEAASAYDTAHQPHEAAVSFYRAARTAAGLGDETMRNKWADAASTAAAVSGDVELETLCNELPGRSGEKVLK